MEEIQAQGAAAACQATRDYDPSRGVPLAAFVFQRVKASIYTRYRQEWSYAVRSGCTGDPDGSGRPIEATSDLLEICLLLRWALAQLRPTDRTLIDQLFWKGETETDIAQRLGISHQAISKRKRAILRELRGCLGPPKKG